MAHYVWDMQALWPQADAKDSDGPTTKLKPYGPHWCPIEKHHAALYPLPRWPNPDRQAAHRRQPKMLAIRESPHERMTTLLGLACGLFLICII